MSTLRMLVFLASLVQLAIGGSIAYGIFIGPEPSWMNEAPSWLAIVIMSTVTIAGLAGLLGLMLRAKPSQSRASTAKLNVILLLVAGGAAAALFYMEQQRGMSLERGQVLAFLFGALTVPFLLNSMALSMMERRLKKAS
ncbi:MAG: hypothetical protein KC983_00690 [Phycisphaerales bacterium]|nr:hypothetical protein [Phycisphaerales bacterium]